MKIELVVEMDDGRTLTVHADQRDWARWEVQPFADEDRRTTKMRFLAWSTMTRQGLTAKAWDLFNETDCVEVEAIVADAEEDQEGEQGLNPGRRTTNGGAAST